MLKRANPSCSRSTPHRRLHGKRILARAPDIGIACAAPGSKAADAFADSGGIGATFGQSRRRVRGGGGGALVFGIGASGAVVIVAVEAQGRRGQRGGSTLIHAAAG